jgi:hypothetical protein
LQTIKALEIPNLKKIEPRCSQSTVFIDRKILMITGGKNHNKYFKDVFIVDI